MKLSGNRCQCAGCGLYFNSEGAFNKHRTGSFYEKTRRCMSVDEMKEAGMAVASSGYWVSSLWTGADFSESQE